MLPTKPELIEKQYIYPDGSFGLLTVSFLEWRLANDIATGIIVEKKKKTGLEELKPFRIPRELIEKSIKKPVTKTQQGAVNHDFLVIPLKDGTYRIGAIARADAYFTGIGVVDKSDERTGTVKVVEGVLGEGNFGKVLIVQWQDGRVDAVKIGPAALIASTEERDILVKLGLLVAAFIEKPKPKIGEVVPRGQEAGLAYLIQKKIPGINLSNYFSKVKPAFRLKKPTKIQMALKMAEAIKGLHDKNILHNDVKPANLLVSWDDQNNVAAVFPVDFGASMQLTNGQTEIKTREVCGSPGYIAPEIAEFERDTDGKFVVPLKLKPLKTSPGVRCYSKASDVYSLGKLFKGDLKLADGEGSSSLLYLLTDRMQAPDPKDRPTMAEVVITLQYVRIQNYLSAYGERIYEQKALVDYKTGKRHELTKAMGEAQKIIHAKRGMQLVYLGILTKYIDELLELVRAKAKSRQPFQESSGYKKLVEDTADKILSKLKESQKQPEIWSDFNLQFLKYLPEELRQAVYKKLGLNLKSEKDKETIAAFEQRHDYETRELLAECIEKYKYQELQPPAAHYPQRPRLG